jgi:hypothetical protein
VDSFSHRISALETDKKAVLTQSVKRSANGKAIGTGKLKIRIVIKAATPTRNPGGSKIPAIRKHGGKRDVRYETSPALASQ